MPRGLALAGDALRAEHGFSALVTITQGGRATRVLFDTGHDPDGMVENMRRLELSPRDVDLIVLSHGHWDHTTGMEGLVARARARQRAGADPPGVLVAPADRAPGQGSAGAAHPSRGALEGAGFEIMEERQPSFLLDGSLLVTGEVDRTTEFEHGLPHHEAHRDGAWRPDPLILDDQALVANVAGARPVRAHRLRPLGIVNILRYVRRLTGIDRLHAVVGGFHLSGPAFEPIIGPTCDALAELAPDHLVPAHCTGWRAMQALPPGCPRRSSRTASGPGWSSVRPRGRTAARRRRGGVPAGRAAPPLRPGCGHVRVSRGPRRVVEVEPAARVLAEQRPAVVADEEAVAVPAPGVSRAGGGRPASSGDRSAPSMTSGASTPAIASSVGPTSWVEAK